jgi:hypothetical protein
MGVGIFVWLLDLSLFLAMTAFAKQTGKDFDERSAADGVIPGDLASSM